METHPPPAVSPAIEVDRLQLLDGKYPFSKILESGRHLFTTAFTDADGHGEGGLCDSNGKSILGPRQKEFRDNLDNLKQRLGVNVDASLIQQQLVPVRGMESSGHFDILRLNGLDSQSCFECHDTIGSEHLTDTRSKALARRAGATAGPAGIAATAFINPRNSKPIPKTTGSAVFPNPAYPDLWPDPSDPKRVIEPGYPYFIFKIVRNPPHVFGTGYAQRLAQEMTFQLFATKVEVLKKAAAEPGKVRSMPLKVSGVRPDLTQPDPSVPPVLQDKSLDFGEFSAKYLPGASPPDIDKFVEDYLKNPPEKQNPPKPSPFEEISDKVVGVSRDLVVRPFQWKGIASSERNFVNDALNFHFGMMSVEKALSVSGDPKNHDPDSDGVKNELSIGNISALTMFAMAVRPPSRIIVAGKDGARIQKGTESFLRGFSRTADFQTLSGYSVPQATSCAACHVPTMRIHSNLVSAEDPIKQFPMANGKARLESVSASNLQIGRIHPLNSAGLSSQRLSTADLPVTQQFFQRLNIPNAPVPENRTLKGQPNGEAYPVFPKERIDLGFNLTTLEQVRVTDQGALTLFHHTEDASLLSITQARLKENPPSLYSGKLENTIDVPLFSDLKRHRMGEALADNFEQETDVKDIYVEREEFLTRPLWGVANTAPYIHDGRALSLEEAIRAHGSKGSEAEALVKDLLAEKDLESLNDIVAFLLTLRLPHDPRYEFDKNFQQGQEETREALPQTVTPLKFK